MMNEKKTPAPQEAMRDRDSGVILSLCKDICILSEDVSQIAADRLCDYICAKPTNPCEPANTERAMAPYFSELQGMLLRIRANLNAIEEKFNEAEI